MKITTLTQNQKTQLTKQITLQRDYINSLLNECKTQHPQPNGTQYLHGEVITLRDVNNEINYLNNLCRQRGLAYEMNTLTFLPKYEKPVHITEVPYTEKSFNISLTYVEKMYLLDMCEEDVVKYCEGTITQKIVKSIISKLSIK